MSAICVGRILAWFWRDTDDDCRGEPQQPGPHFQSQLAHVAQNKLASS